MIVQIVDLMNSNKDNKRYKVILNNGKSYDFGLKGASTFLEHHDPKKRSAYWARHFKNPLEQHLIASLTPSPALFSASLLWGPYTDIHKNIKHLNEIFKKENITI